METIVLNPEIVNKFKKMPTAQLMIKASKMTGEEREVAISLLKARGQDVARFETPKNTFVAEPEEELTDEEQAMLDEAEKGMEPLKKSSKAKNEKVVKEKVVKEKKVREPREKKEKVAREPKDLILKSKEVEGIESGVEVEFTLNKRRGGEVCVGIVHRVHIRGEKEFILIKTENGIVSKRPSALTVIS